MLLQSSTAATSSFPGWLCTVKEGEGEKADNSLVEQDSAMSGWKGSEYPQQYFLLRRTLSVWFAIVAGKMLLEDRWRVLRKTTRMK